MSEFIKPNNIDEEIILDPNKFLISKTDKFGNFEFANDYFMEVSGYEEYELMGKSMFCIQHPDMPEVIYKMMWEKLLEKKDCHVVVKSLAKNGKYYWSINSFTFKVNDDDGEITAIFNKRIAACKESKEYFSNLYKTLLQIEKQNGIQASEKFLVGLLEEKQLDFKGLLRSTCHSDKIEMLAKSKKVFAPFKKAKKETSVPKLSVEFEKVEKVKPEVEEISKKEVKKIKKVRNNANNEEKSLFQRLFGKTDEEIEAERRRNKERD